MVVVKVLVWVGRTVVVVAPLTSWEGVAASLVPVRPVVVPRSNVPVVALPPKVVVPVILLVPIKEDPAVSVRSLEALISVDGLLTLKILPPLVSLPVFSKIPVV